MNVLKDDVHKYTTYSVFLWRELKKKEDELRNLRILTYFPAHNWMNSPSTAGTWELFFN